MEESRTARRFNGRAFVALMIAISGLGLPLTGYANHVYGLSRMSIARHAWMSAHNVLGILFVVFSIWHIVLNRRALWKHVRSAAGSVRAVSREAIVAAAITAAVLLVAVGHAFHAGGVR